MKIQSAELKFGYGNFMLSQQRQNDVELAAGRSRNSTGKDRVSISSLGRRQSSNKKLHIVASQSVVRDRNGHESKLSHSSLNFSRKDTGRTNRWQLGISNIRNSGQSQISLSSRTRLENEQMSFVGTGNISMADGRQVEFSLEMLMQREFEMQESENLNASTVQLMDPLVINFSGTTSTLTDTKYQFDLDSDGFYENISFVGQGSGFLTLDVNKDGIVNNGQELFGPNMGNGFEELKAYDQDGNQWIDENDQIYEELKVWSKDGSGNDQLRTLKELGIGAISLENVATSFSITNHQNELQGQVRRSSIVLMEDGSAHTMQQIDLRAQKTTNAVVSPEAFPTQEVIISKQDLGSEIIMPTQLSTVQETVNQLRDKAIELYMEREKSEEAFVQKIKHEFMTRRDRAIADLQAKIPQQHTAED